MTLPRTATITVNDETIAAPQTTFTICRAAVPTQDRGHITLHNAPPNQINPLSDRGAPITVDAGYPPNDATIFDGTIQEVRRSRATGPSPHTATRITLGDHVNSPIRLGGATNRAWAGTTPLAHIVRDLAADLRLPTGPLTAIPDTATATNWTWTGPTKKALKRTPSRPRPHLVGRRRHHPSAPPRRTRPTRHAASHHRRQRTHHPASPPPPTKASASHSSSNPSPRSADPSPSSTAHGKANGRSSPSNTPATPAEAASSQNSNYAQRPHDPPRPRLRLRDAPRSAPLRL